MTDRKLHALPAGHNPAYVLHGFLEQLEEIESVIIGVRYRDGTGHVGWSNMPAGNLAFLTMQINGFAEDELRALRAVSSSEEVDDDKC